MIIDFDNFLNEISTHKTETDYKFEIVQHTSYDDEVVYRYIFNSKNNNTYILDFEPLYEEIKNNEFLKKSKNILTSTINNEKYAKIISVEFTISGRTENDYNEPTNINENYDVLSRVSYLIDLFLNNFAHFDIYIIGYVNNKKLSLYSNYHKLFKNFNIVEAKSDYFIGGLSTFFIKNN